MIDKHHVLAALASLDELGFHHRRSHYFLHLADDLDRISGILEAALPIGDDAQKRYCAQFISSVALSAHDQKLADAAANFFRRMDQGRAGKRSGQAVLDALRDRLAKRTAIVSANRV